MDAGHGRQVLASAATAALLPWDVARIPLGEFRLKGLDAPEVIVQIGPGSSRRCAPGRPTAYELATLAAEGRAMNLDELLSIAPAAVVATVSV